MGVTIIKGEQVTRPDTTPITSNIFDHADVQENLHWGLREQETGLWPSYNCLDTRPLNDDFCAPMTDPKTFDFAEWQEAFSFGVYGGVQCNAVGLDQEDMQREVNRVFETNEAKGVERALRAFLLTGANSTDVSVAGMPLNAALAVLEGQAADRYAGVATIHMPRAAASLLNERIVWEGGKAYTRSGSKVVVGGGYDDPAMLGTANWTMFATGEVYVEKSDGINIRQMVYPGDGSGIGSDENGLPDNTVVALAERMFRVAFDCMAIRATGKAWA